MHVHKIPIPLVDNLTPSTPLHYYTEFYAHAFGSKDTEKVRITYKGNSQYAPFSETVTVNLSDERNETQVVIQEGITIR